MLVPVMIQVCLELLGLLINIIITIIIVIINVLCLSMCLYTKRCCVTAVWDQKTASQYLYHYHEIKPPWTKMAIFITHL